MNAIVSCDREKTKSASNNGQKCVGDVAGHLRKASLKRKEDYCLTFVFRQPAWRNGIIMYESGRLVPICFNSHQRYGADSKG